MQKPLVWRFLFFIGSDALVFTYSFPDWSTYKEMTKNHPIGYEVEASEGPPEQPSFYGEGWGFCLYALVLVLRKCYVQLLSYQLMQFIITVPFLLSHSLRPWDLFFELNKGCPVLPHRIILVPYSCSPYNCHISLITD